jgi:hypothetical protein
VLTHLAWRYVTVGNVPPWRSLIVCGVVLVIVGQIVMLVLRRGAWHGSGAAPADLLRLTIRRCDVGLRLILAQWIGLGISLLVFATWFALKWTSLAGSVGRERLVFAIEVDVVAQIPIVLVFAAWTAWYSPRLHRRRALARRLAAELERVKNSRHRGVAVACAP